LKWEVRKLAAEATFGCDGVVQVYIDGEFVGGCDIMIETYQNGELREMLEVAINS